MIEQQILNHSNHYNKTIDMRDEHSSCSPTAMSHARVLILEDSKIEQLAQEIADYSELHTIVALNTPVGYQSHRIGHLFQTPETEDGGDLVPTKTHLTHPIKLFIRGSANPFEVKVPPLPVFYPSF